MALLSPVGKAIGFACLVRPNAGHSPVGMSGGFAIEPWGGGIAVAPREGTVRVQIVVSRQGRPDRIEEALVSEGETLFMKSGLIRIRTELRSGTAPPCEGFLSIVGADDR